MSNQCLIVDEKEPKEENQVRDAINQIDDREFAEFSSYCRTR